MPNSRHPFERSVGGKGDRDIRKNPKKYRESLFWKKSECCDSRVEPMPHSDGGDKYTCKECEQPCQCK